MFLMFLRWFYMQKLNQPHLVKRNAKNLDIVFRVISTLTEPEGIEMFPMWSTGDGIFSLHCDILKWWSPLLKGKLVTGFWSAIIMFFVMFYNSNFRQYIIVPTYDPEIRTDEDVLKYGITKIHTDRPQERLHHFYAEINYTYPQLYSMASHKKELII